MTQKEFQASDAAGWRTVKRRPVIRSRRSSSCPGLEDRKAVRGWRPPQDRGPEPGGRCRAQQPHPLIHYANHPHGGGVPRGLDDVPAAWRAAGPGVRKLDTSHLD